MKRSKIWLVLIAAAAAVCLLTACGEDTKQSEPTAASVPTVSATESSDCCADKSDSESSEDDCCKNKEKSESSADYSVPEGADACCTGG